MAWTFTPASWTNGVTVPHVADFQAMAADIHTWGGNVDAAGYQLVNLASLGFRPGGLGATNPFAAVYPPNIAYPNTNPAQKTILLGQDASLNVFNQCAYGDLDTAVTATFSINSNRPGGANGYTAPAQIGTLQEVGCIALSVQADTLPATFRAAGTFTATTFTPTTNFTSVNVTYPYGSSSTVTQQSLLRVGMWVITDDVLPFYGQITAVGTGTGVTVAAWYQAGSSTGGTPAGANVFVNANNHTWAMIPEIWMNSLSPAPTATTSNGSATLSSVSSTVGVQPGQKIAGAGIPANTAVVAVGSSTITLSQNATATASGVTLTISALANNHGVLCEGDVNNQGPAVVPIAPVALTGGVSVATGTNQARCTVTGLSSIPANVCAGMYVYDPSGHIQTCPIVAVLSSSSLLLSQQAVSAGTGLTLIVFSSPFEGGVGFDLGGVGVNSNAAFQNRGNFIHGFRSHGAADSAFILQANAFAAVPSYGFRVDGSIAGFPGSACFAVTNDRAASVLWSVDASGNMHTSGAMQLLPGNGLVACQATASSSYNEGLWVTAPSGSYLAVNASDGGGVLNPMVSAADSTITAVPSGGAGTGALYIGMYNASAFGMRLTNSSRRIDLKFASCYLTGVPTYASDSAAGTGGLTTGALWQDSSGGMHIKL